MSAIASVFQSVARAIDEIDWEPVSKPALIGWLGFYSLFLVHAATSESGFLVIDHVNFIVHEAGHLLFGWFGPLVGLWGGTLFELIVPMSLAAYFTFRRQTTGACFSLFFYFENFLYIARYMADARAQELPLATVGDAENAMHDWFQIFSRLGVLEYDTQIGYATKAAGWLGMIATVAWLFRQSRSTNSQ